MRTHEPGSGEVTDELLARRILALEERLERMETTRPPTPELFLDTLIELRRDTADRFDRMDRRFDGMDRRLDGMDRRLDGMDQRLDGMDRRLEGVERRLDGVERRLDGVERRLDQVITLLGGSPGPS